MNPQTPNKTGELDQLAEALEIGASAALDVDDFVSELPVSEIARTVEAEAAPQASVIEEYEEENLPENNKAEPRARQFVINPRVHNPDDFKEAARAVPRVPRDDAIVLPSVSEGELTEIVKQYPRAEMTGSEANRTWLEQLVDSQALLLHGDILTNIQYREGAEWTNRAMLDEERVGIARPRFGDENDTGLMTGERARQRITSALGLGATLRFPLWHSGIHVTLKAPTDVELLELHRLVETEKASLGRMTHSMLYSNAMIVTNMHLVDFALRHVYNASVSFNDPEELKSIIVLDDMQTLIWGLLGTIYPNGYPYKRACVSGPTVCTREEEANLLFTKLAQTTHVQLTEFQRKHMRSRSGKMPLDVIKRYQKEHSFKVQSEVVLGTNTRGYLRRPTLADYEASGRSWLNSLQESTEAAFAGRFNNEETNRHIVQSAQTTAVRNYAHYFEKIVQRNERVEGDNIIEDRETLENVLGDISADGELYDTVVAAVTKFIEDTTMFFLAIPRYHCPSCNADQGLLPVPADAPEGTQPQQVFAKHHPILIPLDMASLFFITTARLITRALTSRKFQR